jgi:hypothetical protein
MLPPGAIIVVSLSLPVSPANARIEVSSTTFETLLIINRADNPIRSLVPTRGFFIHKNMRQGTVPEVKKTVCSIPYLRAFGQFTINFLIYANR